MTNRRRHGWVLTAAAILIGIAVGAFALVPVGGASGAVTTKRDKDCADFVNQAQAQSYFEAQGPGDPDLLDGDGDGRACEDLPCPCATGGGGGQVGGGNDGGGAGNGAGGAKGHAVVSGIADGDTIDVHLKGRAERVRLIGIDTPEVYFGADCGGAQASAAMKRILQVGDRVELIRDRSQDNRDRYGRLLRYVVHAGRDVGQRQIRKGWAKTYVFETPFQRLSSYRSAQRAARRADRGVWRLCHANFHKPL